MSDIIFGEHRNLPKQSKVKEEKEKKKRKIRSDKRCDIKYPLSKTDKRALMYKALEHNMKISSYSSMIVEVELDRSNDCHHYEYSKVGEFVHACLSQDDFKRIQTLSIEWGVPYREVAFRLVKNYLMRISSTRVNTSGGIKIISYREEQ